MTMMQPLFGSKLDELKKRGQARKDDEGRLEEAMKGVAPTGDPAAMDPAAEAARQGSVELEHARAMVHEGLFRAQVLPEHADVDLSYEDLILALNEKAGKSGKVSMGAFLSEIGLQDHATKINERLRAYNIGSMNTDIALPGALGGLISRRLGGLISDALVKTTLPGATFSFSTFGAAVAKILGSQSKIVAGKLTTASGSPPAATVATPATPSGSGSAPSLDDMLKDN